MGFLKGLHLYSVQAITLHYSLPLQKRFVRLRPRESKVWMRVLGSNQNTRLKSASVKLNSKGWAATFFHKRGTRCFDVSERSCTSALILLNPIISLSFSVVCSPAPRKSWGGTAVHLPFLKESNPTKLGEVHTTARCVSTVRTIDELAYLLKHR